MPFNLEPGDFLTIGLLVVLEGLLSADNALVMAVMVLAIVPILIVYPFVQRHFTKGVIFGAIKG